MESFKLGRAFTFSMPEGQMKLEQIGIVRSPYDSREGVPIQNTFSESEGKIELFEDFSEGIRDLDGFTHAYILYWFHLSEGFSLSVTPFMDTESRGLFSTRAPKRPNPIGLSIVEIQRVEGNVVHVKGLDVVDGTPLIDIKPYFGSIDPRPDASDGWATGKIGTAHVSDDRFSG